ncbi:hypothetical protein C8R43DRAFT_1030757 [Mycena crocata]|nr:hypothetical protein C8R43DRAFT_1030757 [Mycena crocata]
MKTQMVKRDNGEKYSRSSRFFCTARFLLLLLLHGLRHTSTRHETRDTDGHDDLGGTRACERMDGTGLDADCSGLEQGLVAGTGGGGRKVSGGWTRDETGAGVRDDKPFAGYVGRAGVMKVVGVCRGSSSHKVVDAERGSGARSSLPFMLPLESLACALG